MINSCDVKLKTQFAFRTKLTELKMKLRKEVQYHLLSIRSKSIYLSDGCLQLKESQKCCWLFEMILSWQSHPNVKKLNYQVWKIKVLNDLHYQITCFDNRDLMQFERQINIGENPLNKIEILLKDRIACLPVELC